MIKINGFEVEVGHFPDGTQCIKFPYNIICNYDEETDRRVSISWFYDSDEELFTLASAVDYIKRNFDNKPLIDLYLPYVPNARMDRIKNNEENFSLKVFANFINSFNFAKVYVETVHSNVSEALINNIVSCDNQAFINGVMVREKPDVIFFPDEGACKRYSDLYVIKNSKLPIAFGIKKREWSTGKIIGLDVISDVDLKDKKVLIIDDICSAGGTFKFSSMKLKEMGAKEVNLYVTHCEDNIQNGDLLKTDLISRIYTTDSILHIEDEKIRIIHRFRK